LFQKNSGPELVDEMKALLGREFSGPFPLAKLNCFKVYKLTLDIWEKLAQAYCALDEAPPEFGGFLPRPRFGQSGLGVGVHLQMFTIMDVSQRMMYKYHAAKIKEHSALLLMRDAFVKMCEGLKVEDFQWSQI
jgi:hypothetical protein